MRKNKATLLKRLKQSRPCINQGLNWANIYLVKFCKVKYSTALNVIEFCNWDPDSENKSLLKYNDLRRQIHFNTLKIKKQYWLVPFRSTIRPSCTWSWISCNVLSNISPALACSTVYGSLGYRNKASKSFGERGRLTDNLKKIVSLHRSYKITVVHTSCTHSATGVIHTWVTHLKMEGKQKIIDLIK